MTIVQSIDNFLQYLEVERNRSLKTVESYAHYLNRFAEWLEGQGINSISDVSEESIVRYRQFLNRLTNQAGQPLAKPTQNYHIIAIRSWLRFLNKRGKDVIPADRIDLAKLGDRSVQFLEHEELVRLLQQPDISTQAGKRDIAILLTLFSTGLRVSELASLNIGQVNLDRREFSVMGKGRKERLVFLSDTARDAIANYLNARTDNDPAVFIHIKDPRRKEAVDTDSLRLTARSIERIVKNHASKAGIVKTVTPHTLRHSFATDLLINGANIRDVQAMLGHASLNTTQVYTHVTNQHLKDVHDAFHDRGS